MATTPRLASAIEGVPAHVGSVLAHAPTVRAAFDEMYAALLGRGTVGMEVKEAMRLRNAAVSDCAL